MNAPSHWMLALLAVTFLAACGTGQETQPRDAPAVGAPAQHCWVESVAVAPEAGWPGIGMPTRDCAEAGLLSGQPPKTVEIEVCSRAGIPDAYGPSTEEVFATMPADYPNRGTVLLRGAELAAEAEELRVGSAWAAFESCMASWSACTTDEFCFPPVGRTPWEVEALHQYLLEDTDYARTDDARSLVGRFGVMSLRPELAAHAKHVAEDSERYPEALAILGDFAFRTGAWPSARALYRRIASDPGNASLHVRYRLAVCEYRMGNLDAASRLLGDSSSATSMVEPDSSDAVRDLERAIRDAHR